VGDSRGFAAKSLTLSASSGAQTNPPSSSRHWYGTGASHPSSSTPYQCRTTVAGTKPDDPMQHSTRAPTANRSAGRDASLVEVLARPPPRVFLSPPRFFLLPRLPAILDASRSPGLPVRCGVRTGAGAAAALLDVFKITALAKTTGEHAHQQAWDSS